MGIKPTINQNIEIVNSADVDMDKTISKEMDELLKEFKNESSYEDIKIKEKIKEQLIKDPRIIHALNASDLDETVPRDYYGKYILPYYILTDTQTQPNNYLCYETSFTEFERYNDVYKLQQITFYILCSDVSTNIIDKVTGVARHDLIAALIIDRFNWTNLFGIQIHLVSDQSRPIDNHFCARTLVFEQTTPNSILKNGKVVNKLGNFK